MPFLNSTFDTTVRMNLDDREIKKCFVNFCEDGSTIPKDLHEFFNCSDIGDVVCTLTALMGPRNDSCWIPGFSSCISKRKIKKTNATLQKNWHFLFENVVLGTTKAPPTLAPDVSIRLRKLCWETMFGQELVKLTVMDLVGNWSYFSKHKKIWISYLLSVRHYAWK